MPPDAMDRDDAQGFVRDDDELRDELLDRTAGTVGITCCIPVSQ